MGNYRFIIFHRREYGNDIAPVFDDYMMVCETVGWMIIEEFQAMKDRPVIGLCYEIFPVFMVPLSEPVYFHIEYEYSKRTHVVNDGKVIRQGFLQWSFKCLIRYSPFI